MTFSAIAARYNLLPAPSVADELTLECGSMRDYHALGSFHYKGAHPGAATTVYRMMHRAPTVVGRYLRHDDETQIVGVLLRALPHLGCQLRDHATSFRYRGFGTRGAAAMLNREVRTISRVVIDPRWRGLGLAVRLVRHALAHPETVYTEALAAMGNVHPFFERAGMTRYDRPPRPEHARLLDALEHLNLEPMLIASPEALKRRVRHEQQQWLHRELRRWHRAAFRTPNPKLDEMSLDELLVCARDRLLSQPVYYLCRHDLTELDTP
jgi:GNAT superfamily N-acetyltransferase